MPSWSERIKATAILYLMLNLIEFCKSSTRRNQIILPHQLPEIIERVQVGPVYLGQNIIGVCNCRKLFRKINCTITN